MTPELDIAWALAEKYHAGQMYGKFAYTKHLHDVAARVQDATTDERLQVVAVLHDILEDTACTLEILRLLFEDNIVDAVDALTKRVDDTKESYIAKVRLNQMATTVKIHDTLCNLTESVNRGDVKRIIKYADQLKRLVEK
jgi:(p)ppGpp synthase/HD superfamily hydrolase